MVAGLILIVFLAWLYCAKWPRACCSRRSKQMNDDDDRLEEGSELGMPAPNISSLEKDKGRLRDSEQGGLVKKVSGGMVVFTQAPKALGAKDRYPLELEMDHVNGIRLEVLCIRISHALHKLTESVRHELRSATIQGMAVDRARIIGTWFPGALETRRHFS